MHGFTSKRLQLILFLSKESAKRIEVIAIIFGVRQSANISRRGISKSLLVFTKTQSTHFTMKVRNAL